MEQQSDLDRTRLLVNTIVNEVLRAEQLPESERQKVLNTILATSVFAPHPGTFEFADFAYVAEDCDLPPDYISGIFNYLKTTPLFISGDDSNPTLGERVSINPDYRDDMHALLEQL